MGKASRRALVTSAGQLYTLQRELADMKKRRDALDEEIRRQERKVAAAETAFDTTLARTRKAGGQGANGADTDEQALTPGKLPQRVLAYIERQPGKIHTAADLSVALSVKDVQKVRTALARLVQKGRLRRAGEKGEFLL